MAAWVEFLLQRLADSPLLQGLVAALATFVLEDPVTVGAGLLVVDQRMAFATALIGVSAGIAAGDLGLYGIGRLAGPRIQGWGPVTAERVERASGWFRRNLILAVILSRFVPGMRLPTYVAAGALRVSLPRFAMLAVGASLVWTFALLSLTVAAGEAVLPMLGWYRWPVATCALGLLVVAQWRAAGTFGRRVEQRDAQSPVVSYFEFWPTWLFYIPVALYWLWLAVRYRSLTLPTAANPSIPAGGFIGESKSQIMDLVAESQRRWIAPYLVLEKLHGVDPGQATARALQSLSDKGLSLPVVAKPDVGQRGDGVRPIRSERDLHAYLASFPDGERLMLQALVGDSRVDGPREAGVLYFRRPGEDRGTLFSITLKSFPVVVGDDRRTVRQLIEDDPRARCLANVYLERHSDELDRIPAAGERFDLVFAGNHCQGAIFTDGRHLATEALANRIEGIARSMPGFDFGRFDIRFDDLDAFRCGEDLKIVEINAASGEATHIWDASSRLGDAYRTLFRQFKALFEIGAANRRRGHRPIGVARFFRDVLRYRGLARSYPSTE